MFTKIVLGLEPKKEVAILPVHAFLDTLQSEQRGVMTMPLTRIILASR